MSHEVISIAGFDPFLTEELSHGSSLKRVQVILTQAPNEQWIAFFESSRHAAKHKASVERWQSNTTQSVINCWPLGELNMVSKKCGLAPETVKKKKIGRPLMTKAWIFPCTVNVCRFFSIFLRSRVLLTMREKIMGKLPPVSTTTGG